MRESILDWLSAPARQLAGVPVWLALVVLLKREQQRTDRGSPRR